MISHSAAPPHFDCERRTTGRAFGLGLSYSQSPGRQFLGASRNVLLRQRDAIRTCLVVAIHNGKSRRLRAGSGKGIKHRSNGAPCRSSLPQLADDLAADDSNSCQAGLWGIPAGAGAGCLPVPPPRVQINNFAHARISSSSTSRKRELGGRLFACLQKGFAT